MSGEPLPGPHRYEGSYYGEMAGASVCGVRVAKARASMSDRIIKPRGVGGKTVDEVINRSAEIMGRHLAGKVTHENSKARCARLAQLIRQTREGAGFDARDRDEVTRILVDPNWSPHLG